MSRRNNDQEGKQTAYMKMKMSQDNDQKRSL